MANWNVVQNQFTEGEISPRFLGQAGSELVQSALQHIENGLVVPQGPVITRPGTSFIYDLEITPEKCARIWPFIGPDNNDQLAVFSENTVSVADPVDGTVSAGTAPYVQKLANPSFSNGFSGWDNSGQYTKDNVTYVDYDTGDDFVFFTITVPRDEIEVGREYDHPFVRQQFNSADAIINFSFNVSARFESLYPQDNFNAYMILKIGTTLDGQEISYLRRQLSGPLQVVNSSTNVPGGVAGQIYASVSFEIEFTSKTALLLEHFSGILESVELFTQKDTPPVSVDFTTPYDGTDCELLHFVQSPFDGKELICLHPDYPPHMLRVSGGVWEFAPFDFTDPVPEWGGDNGWPSIGAGFQGRLWLSGVKGIEETVWASEVGNWRKWFLAAGATVDTDPIEITSQERGEITWLLGFKSALYGTVKKEYILSASNEVLTPTDIAVKGQTAYGCLRMPQKIPIGSSVVLPAAGNTALRLYQFNRNSFGYIAPDITLKAEHLGRKIFRRCFYTRDPHQILWNIMEDGSLAVMTFDEDQGIMAWSRIVTDGKFLDGCAITDENGGHTAVFIVERIIEGVQKKYIEKIEPLRDTAQWKYIDSNTRLFTNGASGVTGGLSHLEGKEVSVFLDGRYDGEQSVTNGEIDVKLPSSYVDVGLAYNYKISSFPQPALTPDAGINSKKRFSKVGVRGVFSRPPVINGQRPAGRSPRSTMGNPEPSVHLLDSTVVDLKTDETGVITVEEPLPISLTVAAIFGKLTSNQL